MKINRRHNNAGITININGHNGLLAQSFVTHLNSTTLLFPNMYIFNVL